MTIWEKMTNWWQYQLLKRVHPEIIGGYFSPDGVLNKLTRVSNVTHISNKKNVFIHDNVFIGHFNYIDGFNKVTIEKGCQITNYVSILTHSSHNSIRIFGKHYAEKYGDSRVTVTGEVSIGAYTFIGPHSVIMPGVKLGKGCIVSAYSFVNGEFPDYSIIQGQPARVIGQSSENDKQILSQFPDLTNYYYNHGSL